MNPRKNAPPRAKSQIVNHFFVTIQADGLKLDELAFRANREPPRLSEYRRGASDPTVTAFEQLVDAAGYRLVLESKH